MLVTGLDAIIECTKQHADSKSSLDSFVDIARRAAWKNIMEVRQTYPQADAVGNCTVFNIKGNRYRLIATIDYRAQIIDIKRVLTHAEYDKEKWKKDCDG